MPHEDRTLIFDFDEAKTAIAELCAKQDIQEVDLNGYIQKLSNPDGDKSRITFQFKDDATKQEHKEEYSRDFVAAALMMYCKKIGIPLPQKGEKFITFDGDTLRLRIKI